MAGLLQSATVSEAERMAWGVYQLPNGKHIICSNPLTDAEFNAYRRYPDTFFGVLSKQSVKVENAVEINYPHQRWGFECTLKGLLLPEKFTLIFQPIQFILVSYIFSYHILILAYCICIVSPTPEMTTPIPISQFRVFIKHSYCRLSFQFSNHFENCILRWYC